MGKHHKSYFALAFSVILLVNCVSAGLLQSIREAAFLVKDSADAQQASRDSRGLKLEQSPSNHIGTEYSFFEKQPENPCPPGNFLCLAQKTLKSNVHNEMSNAMIKSVATIMTEMLNSTITKSVGDIIATGRNSNDPQKQEEARQAMSMVTGALQTVSSKVIQAFAYFVKVSISGVMWDFFHQVVKAARNSPSGIAAENVKTQTPTSLQGNKYFEYSTSGVNADNGDLSGINPSSIDNNNLKREVKLI